MPLKPVIQIDSQSAVLNGSNRDKVKLSQSLSVRGCVKFENFLSAGMLSRIGQLLSAASFYDSIHKGIARESCMRKNALFDLFHFLLNDQIVFDFIQSLTGCKKIRCFRGRLYRLLPDARYYDSWHSDWDGKRMVGLSINLSPQVYEGGVFQIRLKGSQDLLSETANTGTGDALCFRLGKNRVHRVTSVTGQHPKVAFAGWFQNQPSFISTLQRGLKKKTGSRK